MALRTGMTYRIYDLGKLTVAFDHPGIVGRTGPPTINFIYRQPVPNQRGPKGGVAYRRFNLPLPIPNWATCYKYRRFGALKVYGLVYGRTLKMFKAPRV